MAKQDLLTTFKKPGQPVDMVSFKENVVALFDDVMQRGEIVDRSVVDKLAQIRAHLVIKFRDL